MIVFGLEKSAGLAWEVAKVLGAEQGKIEVKWFPDDECYMRVQSRVKNQEVAVIASIRSSDDFVSLLLTLDALRGAGARLIHTVTPYLAYMRQDKIFKEGEALSARMILRMLDELSDDITTVNCHFLDESGLHVFHDVNLRNLDAIPIIVEYFGSKVKNPLVIAPDAGSLAYAKRAAQLLDCEFNHLQKKRLSGEEVVIKDKTIDAKGRDVIILDDIISTGGTILNACKVIRSWRPSSINVGCVHGLFLNGFDQFSDVVDRLVCTNSLETPLSKVSVAKLIAKDLLAQ